MSPPDIARHPALQIGHAVNDRQLNNLALELSGGGSSNTKTARMEQQGQEAEEQQQGQQRQRSKSLFASLRFKGKKR